MSVSKETAEDETMEATWLNFYQVIRSLEQESKVRIGSDEKVEKEPVRIFADAESTFPIAEFAKIRHTDKAELEVSFFGLFGASGCLPRHYSQLIVDRIRQRDYALRDFLNIFNHRFISLFYRVWEKHHYPIAFETSHCIGDTDRIRQAFQSFIGNLLDGHHDQASVDDSVFLHFGGHFSSVIPRGVELKGILENIFQVRTRVQELVGQWLMLAPSEQSRLTPSAKMGGWNQLGKDTVAGSRIWDLQNRFRITLGPVSYQEFLDFLPDPKLKKLRQLADVTRRYVGPQFDFDVQVLLRSEDIPPLQLGGPSARLGWSTWLGQDPEKRIVEDAIFQLPDRV